MINDKKVKKHSNLVKRSGAVIDTDKSAYELAKHRREQETALIESIQRTKELELRVDELDTKLDLIIELLKGKQ